MKYFLKRYLPVVKANSRIIIGVGPKEILEVQNNEKSIHDIEKIVREGITEQEIAELPLYQDMFNRSMLTIDNSRQRKEMYLDYLGVKMDQGLLDTKILVLGAGGMGSTTAYLLAQFGFKDLTIVDFDIVEKSDIEKMIVYKKHDLGKLKIDALKVIIEDQFDYCSVRKIQAKITSKTDLKSVIDESNAQLIIRAMDPKEVVFRFWLNEICFSKRIPFLVSSYAFEYLRLGPFCVPGVTSCDNCYNLWLIEGLGEDYDCSLQEKLFDDYSVHPTISYNINIASNFSLKEIIFFLTEKYEYVSSMGKIVDYHILTMTGKSSIVPFHPKCNICQQTGS